MAGGFVGACYITIGHPFDAVDIKLQTMSDVRAESTPFYYGAIDYINNGILALYKGTAVPVAGVAPVSTICFSWYNLGKKIFAEDPMNLRKHEPLLAQSNSCGTVDVFRHYFSRCLKSRLQNASKGTCPNGIRLVLSELIARDGFFTLY
ncbi:unnamed protein product [Trichobilharzia regenti]|nr:unnamed protein product [Trichobilharzia regenti]